MCGDPDRGVEASRDKNLSEHSKLPNYWKEGKGGREEGQWQE